MKKYALTDIRKYAKQGDGLMVVNSDHGDVVIVENMAGIRFPCRVEQLSGEFVASAMSEVKERSPRQSTKPLSQAEKIQIEYLNSLK